MLAVVEGCSNGGGGPSEQHVEIEGAKDLEQLLVELEEAEASTVSFRLDPSVSESVEFILGVAAGSYVLNRYYEQDFYQLIGNPDATGQTELRLGGQPTPTPNRWLVSRHQILRVLDRYVRGAELPGWPCCWERAE